MNRGSSTEEIMNFANKVILVLLLSAGIMKAAPLCTIGGARTCVDIHTISSSGDTITVPNNGAIVASFEEEIPDSLDSINITIQGCGLSGICTPLDTYTTVASTIRSPSLTAIYDHFIITATWTGGTNPFVRITSSFTDATSGSSLNAGALQGVLGADPYNINPTNCLGMFGAPGMLYSDNSTPGQIDCTPGVVNMSGEGAYGIGVGAGTNAAGIIYVSAGQSQLYMSDSASGTASLTGTDGFLYEQTDGDGGGYVAQIETDSSVGSQIKMTGSTGGSTMTMNVDDAGGNNYIQMLDSTEGYGVWLDALNTYSLQIYKPDGSNAELGTTYLYTSDEYGNEGFLGTTGLSFGNNGYFDCWLDSDVVCDWNDGMGNASSVSAETGLIVGTSSSNGYFNSYKFQVGSSGNTITGDATSGPSGPGVLTVADYYGDYTLLNGQPTLAMLDAQDGFGAVNLQPYTGLVMSDGQGDSLNIGFSGGGSPTQISGGDQNGGTFYMTSYGVSGTDPAGNTWSCGSYGCGGALSNPTVISDGYGNTNALSYDGITVESGVSTITISSSAGYIGESDAHSYIDMYVPDSGEADGLELGIDSGAYIDISPFDASDPITGIFMGNAEQALVAEQVANVLAAAPHTAVSITVQRNWSNHQPGRGFDLLTPKVTTLVGDFGC